MGTGQCALKFKGMFTENSPPPDMVHIVNSTPRDGQTPVYNSMMDLISQAVEYAAPRGILHVVLSTYYHSFFATFDREGNMRISEGFRNDDTNPTLLQVFPYTPVRGATRCHVALMLIGTTLTGTAY
ncbi:hypothetical protein WJX72_001041 [[Myrmecia] bisecta]|uniref:Uncharacterized protein n=1 Tax=[Myrmecia] bisecta TaxID=41462 RepID=A0AAW1P604_9CHLO